MRNGTTISRQISTSGSRVKSMLKDCTHIHRPPSTMAARKSTRIHSQAATASKEYENCSLWIESSTGERSTRKIFPKSKKLPLYNPRRKNKERSKAGPSLADIHTNRAVRLLHLRQIGRERQLARRVTNIHLLRRLSDNPILRSDVPVRKVTAGESGSPLKRLTGGDGDAVKGAEDTDRIARAAE